MGTENDNELLYLIAEGDEQAYEELFHKYDKLIWKSIKDLNIPYSEYDDFHQEGLIMLDTAIRYYDVDSDKTFNKYFTLILLRQLRYLSKKIRQRLCVEEPITENTIQPFEYDNNIDMGKVKELLTTSEIEFQVLKMYFLEKTKISDISKKLKKTEKQIYNTIYKIRLRAKEVIDNS